jgi:superfamily II DNA or RNA helicase
LVPLVSLVDQTIRAFAAEGIDAVGVMQATHPLTDCTQPVQVVSVQTLARRKRPDADIVFVDEAHLMHKAALLWLADPDQKRVVFLGLSATPWARGLAKYYDHLIIAASIEDLIGTQHLSPFQAFAPSEPDLAGVRVRAGDFAQDELAERCNTKALVGDVVAEWLKRGEGRPTLCYGVNRKHARHMQERFIEAGVPCEYIDAYTDQRERERIFDAYRKGEVKIVSSVATLEAGIDLPMTSCIIQRNPEWPSSRGLAAACALPRARKS